MALLMKIINFSPNVTTIKLTGSSVSFIYFCNYQFRGSKILNEFPSIGSNEISHYNIPPVPHENTCDAFFYMVSIRTFSLKKTPKFLLLCAYEIGGFGPAQKSKDTYERRIPHPYIGQRSVPTLPLTTSHLPKISFLRRERERERTHQRPEESDHHPPHPPAHRSIKLRYKRGT
jgi:hypothetical protein